MNSLRLLPGAEMTQSFITPCPPRQGDSSGSCNPRALHHWRSPQLVGDSFLSSCLFADNLGEGPHVLLSFGTSWDLWIVYHLNFMNLTLYWREWEFVEPEMSLPWAGYFRGNCFTTVQNVLNTFTAFPDSSQAHLSFVTCSVVGFPLGPRAHLNTSSWPWRWCQVWVSSCVSGP